MAHGIIDGDPGAGIVDELIAARVPGELQAATDNRLVESLEPAQAAAAFQGHVLGMHHLLDR